MCFSLNLNLVFASNELNPIYMNLHQDLPNPEYPTFNIAQICISAIMKSPDICFSNILWRTYAQCSGFLGKYKEDG
jgi:hypothetical protein